MRRFQCALAASLLLALAAPQASAQPRDEDWTRCESDDAEVAIAGCSAVIATDGVRPRLLAHAFYARGNALGARGRHEQAIEDYERVIAINPGHVGAHEARALIHLKAGRHDAAIADYDAVLRLEARRPRSLFGRGIARQHKGDAAGGAADIAAAKAIKPDIAEEMAKYGVR